MLARLYPRELDIVNQDTLITALIELVGINKIGFYMGASNHHDQVYGCFPNWGEHQRVRDSKKKCPDPTNTTINDWYLRRYIPISMKIELLQRDNFSCAECGKRIAETDNARAVLKMGAGLFHIDHLVPVNQGGRATMENLRVLCPKCNLSRKRFYTFDEILQFAETCGEIPQKSANICKMPPNPIQSLSEYESESLSESLMDANDACKIQADHDRVFDAAEDAGFKMSNNVRAALVALYADHGMERLLEGLKSCSDHGAPNLAYLKAVLKGEPKKQKTNVPAQQYGQRDYSGEQEDAMRRMIEGAGVHAV